MRYLLLVGLCLSAGAQTLRLRAPASEGGGETLTVVAVSGETPIQLTFSSAHGLSVGDTIHCVGLQGAPWVNGFSVVRAAPSAVSVTLRNQAGADVPGTSALPVDLDPEVPGNQFGYCGRTAEFGLAPHPRGWWPNSGPFGVRLKDPDGAGPQVAPAVSQDPGGWNYLSSQNEINSSMGCDGVSPILCSKEENAIVKRAGQMNEGWPAVLLALGWYMDNSRTNWLNSARYLLRNLHLASPVAQRVPFTACDETAVHCGQGEENNNAAFFGTHWAMAYTLVASQLTAGEKTAFIGKMFNDETTGCQDMLPPLGGAMTGAAGSGIVTGSGLASEFVAGDWLYVKNRYRVYQRSDNTLVSVTVTAGVATIQIAEGSPTPATSTYVQIMGSGSSLDGWYRVVTSTEPVFTVSAPAVADGVYATQGMSVRAPGPGNSTGGWHQVVTVNSDTQMTVSPTLSVAMVNAPYAKVLPFSSTACGMYWFALHHSSAPPQANTRVAKQTGTVTSNATSMVLTADTYDHFADLPLPFFIQAGTEIMKVTARDTARRMITVERGQLLTAQQVHSSNTLLVYNPFGPSTSSAKTQAARTVGSYYDNLMHRILALIGTAAVVADESVVARRWLEYYWNYYYDYFLRKTRENWAGLTPSGAVNLGYFYGSWADIVAWNVLSGLNSFTPPIDLRFRGLEETVYAGIYMARADTATRHLTWGDSGADRTYQGDDLKLFESSPYLYPGETSRAALNFVRTGVTPSFNRETVGFRLAFATETGGNFRDLPTTRFFRETEAGLKQPFQFGGMASRTSWTDPQGTVLWSLVLPGYDHNASYPYPGVLLLAKGPAELIGGTSGGFALFGDARYLNAVEVLPTTGSSTSTGGLTTPASYTNTNGPAWCDRTRGDADLAYVRARNMRYNTASEVISAHRDLFHLKPATGQDYVVVYDRVKTRANHGKVLRIPYYNLNNNGTAAQNPATTYVRTGTEVHFTSNQYGVRLNSKVLYPADSGAMSDDTSNPNATRLTVQGGTQDDVDFLVVHQPCGSLTCTAPAWELLDASAGYRAAQITDGNGTWIVTVAADAEAAVSSVSFTAASFEGSARFVISGLTAGNPFTLYSVIRDGVTILADQPVYADGVLRFEATYGTAGAFTVTSTGSAPLAIITNTLAGATVGASYTATLTAQGGTPGYTWSLASGALPDGLTLSNAGIISGTPTAAGTANFTVRVTDSVGGDDTRVMTLTVTMAASNPLVLSAPSGVVSCTFNTSCLVAFTASGGTPPYMFSLQSGTLPDGMQLNEATGEIVEAPIRLGDYPVSIQVTDSAGATETDVTVIRVRTTGTTLATAVTPGSTAAILTIRHMDLAPAQSCDVIVRQANGALVLSAVAGVGAATRQVVLSPLPAGATLSYEVACGLLTGSGSMWTSSVSGVIPVAVSLHAPDNAGVVSQAQVEYGPTPALGLSQITACPAGCQITLPGLSRGTVVYIRHSWLNAVGQVLAQSTVRPVLLE